MTQDDLALNHLSLKTHFPVPCLFSSLSSAKLARQAQSKEKVLKKMIDGGLTEKVESDSTLDFSFSDCGTVRCDFAWMGG